MDTRRHVLTGLDLTPDLLASQGRALRGLARSLLGDAHAAEDVVQETWLACLRRPAALPQRVSAWLATVTKHLALRRARADGRRRVREQRAAVPERLEGLAQRSLEREEALRAVTQALLALEEPFKTALLLRFYEDRAPAEIADELGVPLATVKSRLARGLERLRAKLGSEFAGDERCQRRALLALAAIPAPGAVLTGSAASTAGTLALAKVAAAALVVTGGALLFWSRREAEARLEPTQVSSADPSSGPPRPVLGGVGASVPAPVPGAARADESQREAVAPEPAAEPERLDFFPPEASFRYRIAGRVRDERDLPLAGARVFLAPHAFPLNRVAVTDSDGRFALEFDARRPALDCALTVDDGGERTLGLRDLRLVAGRELALDVGLNPGSNGDSLLVEMRAVRKTTISSPEVTVAMQAAGAAEPAELTYSFDEASPEGVVEAALVLEERLDRSAFGVRATQPLERAPEMQFLPDGRGLFVEPAPSRVCERRIADLVALEGFLRGQTLPSGRTLNFDAGVLALNTDYIRAFSGAGALRLGDELVIFGAWEPEPRAAIQGIVRDPFGNPVAGVDVGWSRVGAPFDEWTGSDEEGRFRLEGLPPGEVVVRAGGGDHGLAYETIALRAGQEFRWDPRLDRGDEVMGCIVRAGDARTPFEGVRVELWSVSPDFVWSDATLTDAGGRFALPNVPGGSFELHVYASGALSPPSAFPIRVVRPVFAGTDLGTLAVRAEESASSTLEVTVLDSEGRPLPGAEVRVWHTASGRGAFAAEPDEHGALVLGGLPHGAYRVEAGGPFGWRDLGRVWVEKDVDLGEERFATGVALLVGESSGTEALSISVWHAHRDVFGRVETLDELRSAVLPLSAGEHVVCARIRGGARSESPLEVGAGEVSGLTLAVSEDGTIAARPGASDPSLDLAAQPASCAACHASVPSGG